MAFTGHRSESLSLDDESEVLRLQSYILTAVLEAVGRGCRTFICGMADGIDLWAAECVLTAKEKNPHIRLLCVYPFLEGDEEEQIPDSDAAVAYNLVEMSADRRLWTQIVYDDDALDRRNRFMVDNAAHILAVLRDMDSGTGDTVSYAEECGRDIMIIDLDRDF